MVNTKQILEHIDPAKLNYQEWVNVGMALKHEGYSAADWDKWSKKDKARYHAGECEKKWQSFNGSASPVTGGTLIQYAKDQGYAPQREDSALDWDSEISRETDDIPFINNNEGIKLTEPKNRDPKNEVIRYLETLFDASDNVGYVTETWEKNENGTVKYLPTKGSCSRSAGELIAELNKCREIQDVIGDYKPELGRMVQPHRKDTRRSSRT